MSWKAILLVLIAFITLSDRVYAARVLERSDLFHTRTRLDRELNELQGYLHNNKSEQGTFVPHKDSDGKLQDALQDLYSIHRGPPQAFFPNASGYYFGKMSVWNQSHTSAQQVRERGKAVWNHTNIYAGLRERPVPDSHVSHLYGDMTLRGIASDDDSLTTTTLEVAGVHVMRSGRIFLVGTPSTSHDPLDIRHVLGMIPQEEGMFLRNATGQACLADIRARIERLDYVLAHWDSKAPPVLPDQRDPSNCTIQMYAQMMPAGPEHVQTELDLSERELSHPTGLAVVHRAPQFQLNIIGVSSRCGMFVETDTLLGKSRAQFWSDSRYYVAGMICVVFVQLLLMSRECERIQTHTAITRVSGISLFIHANFDAFLCITHTMLAFSSNKFNTPGMLTIGFMKGILFFAFECRLAVNAFRQHNELAQEAAAAAARTTTLGRDNPAQASLLDSEDDSSSDSHVDQSAWHEYRLFLLRRIRYLREHTPSSVRWLIGVIAIWTLAPFFPVHFVFVFLLISSSFWAPQIYCNIQRRSTGLLNSTVLGMTVTRCYVPIYLFCFRFNIFFFDPSPWVWLPIGWCCAQALVLVGQNVAGPLFFLPRSWRRSEHDWNWQPTPAELASMLSQDRDEEASHQADSASPVVLGDCPICLMPNEWGLATAPSSMTGHSAYKSSIVVAPCHHIFHKECLIPWMEIKQICPSCRLPLPVYE